MRSTYPLVIPKTRTINLGDGVTLTKETLGFEIQEQGLSDVRNFMQDLIIDDTAQQIELGNPPQLLTVDGKTDNPIENIIKTAVVIFGTVLATEAMEMVMREIRRAIQSLQMVDTGRLINMSNWQWLFVRRGRGATIVGDPSRLPAFTQGDQLVLSPINVPYASWANMLAKRKDGRKGFMAQATAAVRRLPVFKQFAVYAMFTSVHSVVGDKYPHGTPIIVIRPRIRRSR